MQTNHHDPFFYEDESDLPRETINKYFQMLKEVEWGYKGKPVITSTPSGRNFYYELFMNQNRDN